MPFSCEPPRFFALTALTASTSHVSAVVPAIKGSDTMDQIGRWTTRRLFLQHAAAAGMGLAFGSRRAVANANGTRAVFPGDTWQRAKPESQGVDPAKLQAAVDFMDKAYGPDGAKELVIICNGYLIWEGPQADA